MNRGPGTNVELDHNWAVTTEVAVAVAKLCYDGCRFLVAWAKVVMQSHLEWLLERETRDLRLEDCAGSVMAEPCTFASTPRSSWSSGYCFLARLGPLWLCGLSRPVRLVHNSSLARDLGRRIGTLRFSTAPAMFDPLQTWHRTLRWNHVGT